jgi:hypothetical protein
MTRANREMKEMIKMHDSQSAYIMVNNSLFNKGSVSYAQRIFEQINVYFLLGV